MFQSPTYGELRLTEVTQRIVEYLTYEKDRQYHIIVGTDSQPHNDAGVDFVTAIVIHRVGSGGIYFWKRVVNKKRYVLRQRMYEEAILSLDTAEELLQIMHKDGITSQDVEIHVDIGSKGETKEMIAEIVGMIRGNGYTVKTKPDSFGASKVADRHT